MGRRWFRLFGGGSGSGWGGGVVAVVVAKMTLRVDLSVEVERASEETVRVSSAERKALGFLLMIMNTRESGCDLPISHDWASSWPS